MLPLVTLPGTIRAGMTPHREVFCREEGFDHISRYVTGLLLSPNKTLQGIYDFQIWGKETPPSRRAMHAAVFEAGWAAEGLMPRHRAVIAGEHRGQGREVLSLDWTYAHHDRGPKISGLGSCGAPDGPVSNGGDGRHCQSCLDGRDRGRCPAARQAR